MENTTTNKKAEYGAGSHSRPPVPPFHTGSLAASSNPSSTAVVGSPASTQSNSNSNGLPPTPAAATLSSNAAFYASFFLPITFYKSLEYRLDSQPIFLRRTLRYGLAEIIADRTRTNSNARESPTAQQSETNDTYRRLKQSSTITQLPSTTPAATSTNKPAATGIAPSQSTPVGSRRQLRGHSTMTHTDPRAVTRPYFHPNDLLGLKLAASKGTATAVSSTSSSSSSNDSDSLNAIRLVAGLASKKLNVSVEHVSFHKPTLSSLSTTSSHVPTSSLSRAAAEHALPIARSLQVAAHLLHHRDTVAVLSDQIQRTENDSMSIPPSLSGFPFSSSPVASEDVLLLAPQQSADPVCAYSKTNFAFSTINFLEQDVVSQSKRVFRNKNILRRTHFSPTVNGFGMSGPSHHSHHNGFSSSSTPAHTTASAVVHAAHQKFSHDWCVQIGLAATLQKASSAAHGSQVVDKQHAKPSSSHEKRTSSLESKNNTRPSDSLESSTSMLYEDGTAHEDGSGSSSTRPAAAAYTISLPLMRVALNGTHNLIDDGLVRAPIILQKEHTTGAHAHAHMHDEDEASDIVVGSALLRVQWIYQIHSTHLNSASSPVTVSPSPSGSTFTPSAVATRSMVLSAAPRGVRIPTSIRTNLKSPKAMLVAWRYVYKTNGLPCGGAGTSNSTTGSVPVTTADKNSAHADQMSQFESMLTKSSSPFQSPAPSPSSVKGDVYTQIEYRPNFNCTLCGFQSEMHLWSFDQLVRHMDSCHSEYLLFKYGTASRFTLEEVDDGDATIDTYEIAVTPKDCLSLLSLIAAPHAPKVDVAVSDNDEVSFLSHNEWLASLSDKKGTIKGLPKVFVDALKQAQQLQAQSPEPPVGATSKKPTMALPSPTTTATPSSISTLLVSPLSPTQAQQSSVQLALPSPSPPPPTITEPIHDSPHRFFFYVGFKYCASMVQRRAALAAVAASNRYSRQQDKIPSTAPPSALGSSLKLTDETPPPNMSVKSLLQSSHNFAKAKALKDEVLRRTTAVVPSPTSTQNDGAVASASTAQAIPPLPPVSTFRSRRTAPARHSSALYSRQWYHASTGQPVAICDLGNDSDECADEEWFFASKSQLIDEFDDVSGGEKQFMKIWNEFVLRKQNANEAIYADYLFPNVCASFARICAPLLRGHLRSAFLCHLLTSWEFGLLHYAHIEACMRLVDQFSQGVPIEAGAAYISFHAPSRNPAYASERCATEAEYLNSLAMGGAKSLHATNRNSPHKKPKGQLSSAAGPVVPPTIASPAHALPSARGRVRSDGSSTPAPVNGPTPASSSAPTNKRKYKRSGDAKRAALRSSQKGRRVTRSSDKPDTPTDAKKATTRSRQTRSAEAMDIGSSEEEDVSNDEEEGDDSDEEGEGSGSESASQADEGDDDAEDGSMDDEEDEASESGSSSSSSSEGGVTPRYSQRWAAVQAAGNIRKSLHTEKLRSLNAADRAAALASSSSSQSRPHHAQMKKALPDEEQDAVSEEEEESSPPPRGYPLRSKGKRAAAEDDDDDNEDTERKRNVSDEDEDDHMNDDNDHEDEGKELDSSKPPHKRARFAVPAASSSAASTNRLRYRR